MEFARQFRTALQSRGRKRKIGDQKACSRRVSRLSWWRLQARDNSHVPAPFSPVPGPSVSRPSGEGRHPLHLCPSPSSSVLQISCGRAGSRRLSTVASFALPRRPSPLLLYLPFHPMPSRSVASQVQAKDPIPRGDHDSLAQVQRHVSSADNTAQALEMEEGRRSLRATRWHCLSMWSRRNIDRRTHWILKLEPVRYRSIRYSTADLVSLLSIAQAAYKHHPHVKRGRAFVMRTYQT